MAQFFDLLKNSLNQLHVMTEFLEACQWDEAEMNSKIEVFQDVLEVLPIDEVSELGLDLWISEVLVPVLELNGLTKNQASIISKVILINKEELQQILALGEQ